MRPWGRGRHSERHQRLTPCAPYAEAAAVGTLAWAAAPPQGAAARRGMLRRSLAGGTAYNLTRLSFNRQHKPPSDELTLETVRNFSKYHGRKDTKQLAGQN